MEDGIPQKIDFENIIQDIWNRKDYLVGFNDRYEVRPGKYPSPVGGTAVLVYELDITGLDGNSILVRPSPWQWFDRAKVGEYLGRVAYLYLIHIYDDFRKIGIGTEYIRTNQSALKIYGVNIIYLRASKYVRYWLNRGFVLLDPDRFWAYYDEFCDSKGIDITFSSDFDEINPDYYDYLNDNQLYQPMYKVIDDAG